MNITKHALMRYASRVMKGHIINERTWDQWKERHKDELPEIEVKLKEELKNIEYITTAAYENNKKADFYINKDKMMTYVVFENNLITCYYIEYGLDEIGNKEILNALLNNLKRSLLAKESFEDNNREKRAELNNNLILINSEIYEINKRLERLKGNKLEIEQGLKNINLEFEEIKQNIEVASEKIVRSKMAM